MSSSSKSMCRALLLPVILIQVSQSIDALQLRSIEISGKEGTTTTRSAKHSYDADDETTPLLVTQPTGSDSGVETGATTSGNGEAPKTTDDNPQVGFLSGNGEAPKPTDDNPQVGFFLGKKIFKTLQENWIAISVCLAIAAVVLGFICFVVYRVSSRDNSRDVVEQWRQYDDSMTTSKRIENNRRDWEKEWSS